MDSVESIPLTITTTVPRWRFWVIFASVALASFMAALDVTAVAVALPNITADLHGVDFTWIGSAYALTSTAFLPITGSLANVAGRRAAVLVSLLLFAGGSGLCGGADSMNMLIAGRAVQGMGGGGLLVMSRIVISDMCTLKERGTYFGILGAFWAMAVALGPLAGALLTHRWRYIFFINLPVAGITTAMTVFFMTLKTPRIGLREGLARMDCLGKLLIVGSTACVIVGIVFGGSKYRWTDGRVLGPLIAGSVLSIVAMVHQLIWARYPTIPLTILKERTSIVGYVSTFLHGNIMIIILYYGCVWYQGVHLSTPLQSTVDQLPLYLTSAVFAIIGGVGVRVTGRYKYIVLSGWVLIIAGTALNTMLKPGTSRAFFTGIQVIQGMGLGLSYVTPEFAVLASVPVEMAGEAITFIVFCRTYGQAWGLSIGSTILQNQLEKDLSPTMTGMLHGSIDEAYAFVPKIRTLPPALRDPIVSVLNKAMGSVWISAASLAAPALLMCVLMRQHKLHEVTDEKWGIVESTSLASTPDLEKDLKDIEAVLRQKA